MLVNRGLIFGKAYIRGDLYSGFYSMSYDPTVKARGGPGSFLHVLLTRTSH